MSRTSLCNSAFRPATTAALCSISFHADKDELAILMRQDGLLVSRLFGADGGSLQDSHDSCLADSLLKIAIFGSLPGPPSVTEPPGLGAFCQGGYQSVLTTRA